MTFAIHSRAERFLRSDISRQLHLVELAGDWRVGVKVVGACGAQGKLGRGAWGTQLQQMSWWNNNAGSSHIYRTARVQGWKLTPARLPMANRFYVGPVDLLINMLLSATRIIGLVEWVDKKVFTCAVGQSIHTHSQAANANPLFMPVILAEAKWSRVVA